MPVQLAYSKSESFKSGYGNDRRCGNNESLRQHDSILGRVSCLADGTMVIVMNMVLAFSVEICSIRIAVMAIFGYAQAMLRTFLFQLALMHERKKPCEEIAQQKQNMIDS